MRRPWRKSWLGLAALAAFLAAGRAAVAEVRVRMKANASEVSIANQFQVTVTVEGADEDIAAPTLEGEGFQVLDSRPGRQSSFVFRINGRRQNQSSYTTVFVLRPTRTGTIEIPPVEVSVGGKTYRSEQGLKIQVQPIEPQDHLILELEGPGKAVYPDQEITVVLKVFARRLRGQYRDVDPFPSENGTWPRLSIPWFESMDGFTTEDPQKFLNGLVARGNRGFPVNNYSLGGFMNDAARFRFDRSEVVRKASDGREYPYFEYRLQKKFRAEKPGSYLLGAVLAKGHVFVDQPGQPRGVAVIAQSEPLEVVINAPPEEGRPPFFTGAIGRWTIRAEVKPTKVWVGQPLTLTVTLSGDGVLENVGPPPLAAQEGFAEVFRIHDEPKTGIADAASRSKTFTYGIRPKSAAVKAVPPITFAYFDPTTEKYTTIRTDPLPIEVEEGKSGGIESFDMGPGADRSEVQVLARSLHPLYEMPDALIAARPPPRFGPVHAAALALPPLAALLIGAVVLRRRLLRSDPSLARARQAHRRAAEILRGAGLALKEGKPAEAHSALARATACFIGDRLGLPSAGMTAGDAARALTEAGVEDELVREAVKVFELADGARYGVAPGGDEELARHVESTRRLLARLQDRLPAGKGGR